MTSRVSRRRAEAELKAAESRCAASASASPNPAAARWRCCFAPASREGLRLLPRFHAGGRAAKPPTVYRALEFLNATAGHRIEA